MSTNCCTSIQYSYIYFIHRTVVAHLFYNIIFILVLGHIPNLWWAKVGPGALLWADSINMDFNRPHQWTLEACFAISFIFSHSWLSNILRRAIKKTPCDSQKPKPYGASYSIRTCVQNTLSQVMTWRPLLDMCIKIYIYIFIWNISHRSPCVIQWHAAWHNFSITAEGRMFGNDDQTNSMIDF